MCVCVCVCVCVCWGWWWWCSFNFKGKFAPFHSVLAVMAAVMSAPQKAPNTPTQLALVDWKKKQNKILNVRVVN